jgi:hypothetical protein
MNKEIIINIIEKSDLNQVQKNVSKGIINRLYSINEKEKIAREIVEKLTKEKYFEVVLQTEDVIIYKISDSKSDWDKKYPYRFVYKTFNSDHKEFFFVNSSIVSPTIDIAYISYLEHKYLNPNSHFTVFAMKMLNISENG